ncbi:carboxy terminal-processing peptidase [Neptuniibacter sp.]|uniref:carboxy terminal-processing peptidase n=1 Tax=Neptuniibacter sp. TaxID=1962643 RepID=UPI002623F36A|nr:carboxy terminal-processing peptidase [Neptuniibacter sp.]MCP4596090.1 tail-specific protease [Neptuniibacter sp.]
MPRSLLKPLFVTVLSLLLPVTANAVTTQLKSEPVHKSTLLEISESLRLGHYNRIQLNDDLSSIILDQYLKDLDPSRSYFYRSDIDEFEPHRLNFDDNIKSGELQIAYLIFNRFQQRLEERLNHSIELLESEAEFNFSVEETLNTDREEAAWITSKGEMDDLWKRRIKSALLNLKLADKEADKARELLIKRYKNQLKRAKQVNSEDVFQTFTNAYTKQYDPHTQYFSPRKSENFKINMSLSLEGIGAVLKTENEFTQIVRLVPAGPAEKTGQLKATDRIVGVGQGEDGDIEDVVGWRLDDVVQLIRGPKGTTVRLEIKSSDREDTPSKIVQIVRNKVKLEEQSAQKRILEVDHLGQTFRLGVIEIPAFYIDFAALQRGDKDYKSTSRDVEKLVNELNQENIDGLIVDLRNNGGGSLREANETVGLFIKHGPTVQVKDSSGRVEVLRDRNSKVAYSGPVAVLVNRLSASASEIFAGAIQDYSRGIVIGGQTFGKGTVQTLLPLNHGQLKLTHAKFYRISGGSTQNKGVLPDINFPTLYDPKIIGESALEQALSWDTVRSAPHGTYPSLKPFVSQIDKRYQKRSLTDPDFIYMREQVEHLNEVREESSIIPLQEAALKRERDEAEQWQIDAENRRRALKQLPKIEKLSDLEDELEKDAQGRPINPEGQAMLEESGRILLDAIFLQLQYSSAKAENKQ